MDLNFGLRFKASKYGENSYSIFAKDSSDPSKGFILYFKKDELAQLQKEINRVLSDGSGTN